jgi:hypothetical protein
MASSPPSSVFVSSWARHVAEREERRAQQARAVEQALLVADEVENNCRAALGLQLNACVANQAVLEASVKGLRLHVAGLTRRCHAHGAEFDRLAQAAADVGGLAAQLRATDDSLARIGGTLAWIEGRLGSDE